MRTCLNCGSTTTRIRKPKNRPNSYEHWHKYEGGFLCTKCYDKLIHNPRDSFRNNHRRILFKDKRVHIDVDPRIGICNFCCAVVGVNCKRTNMHHLEYHPEDPLKDAIEICPSCHFKETRKTSKTFSVSRI